MRLINTYTLELEEFHDRDLPEYAILSHTWDVEELSLQDWKAQDRRMHFRGFSKIAGFCRVAREEHSIQYGWCDTNCIDKSSSSELQEAINSMYRYYAQAKCCLVYLADVLGTLGASERDIQDKEVLNSIRDCRWLTRGWTLQELIAPRQIFFHGSDWQCLETERDAMAVLGQPTLLTKLAEWTGIDYRVLTKQWLPSQCSVATRMSWASQRSTTRLEDEAYSLLGIFGVNIPLIYGEGRRAFLRLQEEIIRNSPDHSIFAWAAAPQTRFLFTSDTSILAPSPANFARGPDGDIVQCYDEITAGIKSYQLDNLGLRISLPCIPCTSHPGYWHAILNCSFRNNQKGPIALNAARPAKETAHAGERSSTHTEILGLRRMGAEFAGFTLQCCSTHMDRLAVVQEEELLTHEPKSLLILRQIWDPAWIARQGLRTVDPEHPSQPLKRRIKVKADWDISLPAISPTIDAFPREEWLHEDQIWVQKSRTAYIRLSIGSSVADGIMFIVTPDGDENDIEIGVLFADNKDTLSVMDAQGSMEELRKAAQFKSKLWGPDLTLMFFWRSMSATCAFSLATQVKFNTHFWNLTVKIKAADDEAKHLMAENYTMPPVYLANQTSSFVGDGSSHLNEPMTLQSLVGFPSRSK